MLTKGSIPVKGGGVVMEGKKKMHPGADEQCTDYRQYDDHKVCFNYNEAESSFTAAFKPPLFISLWCT